MTSREKEANENLQKIANFVKENLPEGMGFVVLAFDFNTAGRMMYVSNANREDVIKAMDEFKEKIGEKQFGKHDNVEGKVWYDIEELIGKELSDDTSIWCLNILNYNDFLTTMGDIRKAMANMGEKEFKVFQFAIVEKGEDNAK